MGLDGGGEGLLLRRGGDPAADEVVGEAHVGVEVVTVPMEVQERLGTALEQAALALRQALDGPQPDQQGLEAVEIRLGGVPHAVRVLVRVPPRNRTAAAMNRR